MVGVILSLVFSKVGAALAAVIGAFILYFRTKALGRQEARAELEQASQKATAAEAAKIQAAQGKDAAIDQATEKTVEGIKADVEKNSTTSAPGKYRW